jgi:uncharacterized protein (TIGR02246 family)
MKAITVSLAFLTAALSPLAMANQAPVTDPANAAVQCQAVTEGEISALFDRWNAALQTGDPQKVVANYAEGSVLLPTVSNQVRLTAEEKADYFVHFLANKPVGTIDSRTVILGCNKAVDAGLYTFKYGVSGKSVQARYTYTYAFDGKDWLITSHHSSGMPEG